MHGQPNIKTYQNYVLPEIILNSHTSSGSFFFHGSVALVGLGLLIFEASWSHSGVDYGGLLCT